MSWSWVDTEYSIHWIQHTPSTQDCLSSLQYHDYELTPGCSFHFSRASLHDRPPSASSTWQLKGKVTLSHSHSCEWTHWWIESQHPVRRPSTVSMYSSKLAWSRPLSVSPNSLDYGLQVHLQTRSITACNFARSWPPSAYLQTRSIKASRGISKLARLRTSQVHLQTPSITISDCISQFTWSWPPSESPNTLNYCLQEHQSRSLSASLSSPEHGLQQYHQIR